MDYIINSKMKKIEIFCKTAKEVQKMTQLLSDFETEGNSHDMMNYQGVISTNPAIVSDKDSVTIIY